MRDVQNKCCTVAKSEKPEDYASVQKRECPLVGRKLLATLRELGGEALDFVSIPPPNPVDLDDDNLLSKMQDRIHISKLKDTLLPAKVDTAQDTEPRGSAAAVLAAGAGIQKNSSRVVAQKDAEEESSGSDSDNDDDSDDDDGGGGEESVSDTDSDDGSDDEGNEGQENDSEDDTAAREKANDVVVRVVAAATHKGPSAEPDNDHSADSDNSNADDGDDNLGQRQKRTKAAPRLQLVTTAAKRTAVSERPASGDALDDSDEYASDSDGSKSDTNGDDDDQHEREPTLKKSKMSKRAAAVLPASGGGKRLKKQQKVVRF
eukprot:COSAG05_NODE_103_length_19033_cov_99.004278_19_plen_318_part_00